MIQGNITTKFKKLFAITALSIATIQVSAQELLPEINYLEGGYIDLDLDDFFIYNQRATNNMEGLYVDSRVLISSDIYITAGIKTTYSDRYDFNASRTFNNTTVTNTGTTELEFDERRLGVGYVYESSDNWRVTADLNYLQQEYSVENAGNRTIVGDINDVPANAVRFYDRSVTLNGGIARLGTEYAISPNLTLIGNATYQRISGDGFKLKGSRLNLGANYKLSDDWSLTGNYQISNENAINLGVRYSF